VLALNLLHIGDFAPALEAMERMREVGEALGDFQLQAYAAGTTGRVYTVMGECDAAIGACARAMELAADPVTRLHVVGWLAAAHHENGDPARAIPLFQDALDQFGRLIGAGGYRYRQVDAFLMALKSDAYLMNGEIARAGDLAATALAVSTAGEWRVAVGYAQRALGRIARAAGKLDEAETAQRQSLETFAAVDARCQAARARLDLADVLAARGDREGAAAALRAAREVFGQMRAPQLVARADRLAAAHGLPLG
jgi:tetratricopeptide (TPR) repeat protein